MRPWRFAPAVFAAGIAFSAGLSASCESRAADGSDDLGVATEVQSGAVQKAVEWLGKDCSDPQILYYVDASKPAVFKVRTRSVFGVVLDVTVHHLRFTESQRRDVKKGLYRIEYSPDVQKVANRLDAALTAPLPYSAYAVLPNGGVYIASDLVAGGPPHLPSQINGKTLEQALDQVAFSFGSTVTVGVCGKPRRIDMVFYEALP